MAHEIFNNKFASMLKPAWHQLGVVLQEETPVVDAFNAHIAPLDVQLWEKGVMVNGQFVKTPGKTIGLAEDGMPKHFFGEVTDQYVPLLPVDFVEVLGKAAGRRGIETIGAIKNGEVLFVSYLLGDREIAGNAHRDYLLFTCRSDGKSANELMRTTVRVVCQNTLFAALNDDDSVVKVTHDKGILAETENWAQAAFGTAEQGADAVAAALEHLAMTKVSDAVANSLIEHSFPFPKEPKANVNPLTYHERIRAWEREMERIHAIQLRAVELWQGDAIGYDSPNFAGTGYGALQSVIEMADHIIPSTNAEVAAGANLIGYRRTIKQKAFAWLQTRA